MPILKRIAILGNAGSGKSYLAAKLATKYRLPTLDLDDLFWMPPRQYITKRPTAALMEMMQAKRLEPLSIVEGVYGELMETFLGEAELLIWLDLPWGACRTRLENRRSECVRKFDERAFEKLLAYAGRYWQRDDGRSHAGHRRLLDGFSGARLASNITGRGRPILGWKPCRR